ncbi:MAG: nicotinate-nucleotide adenylyltransferase [Candidatus Eremiobacterota bacterium]
MKKIGIIGGTFNPVHNGHLFIAEEIRVTMGFTRVIFIPNKIPPHRTDVNLSTEEHRWNMLNLAISNNDFFESSRVELDRQGMSYTVDTIRCFYNLYHGDSLFFITGMDALLNYSWYNFPELIDMLTGFIAISRPGYAREVLLNKIETNYPLFSNKIIVVNSLLLEISSSDIRKRLKEGKSIKYLIPDTVEKYISDNKLYI